MWLVAICSAGLEFSVAKSLQYETFLPYHIEKCRVKVPTRGRAVYKASTREVAQWPTYLFVHTEDVGALLEVRNVKSIVKFGGEPALVQDKLVAQLRESCDASGLVLSTLADELPIS